LLEEGNHHDPKRVAEFLNKWKAPPKDAKRVLDDALSRASSDDKLLAMVKGQGRRIDGHQLGQLRESLEQAAGQFKRQSVH
jgi:hypothetical protein